MAEEYEVRAIPLYTKEDTWVKVLDEDTVRIGITDYAQKMLSEIVYVELPEIDSEVSQFESFGSVESVKSIATLYSPITGKVTAVNDSLEDNPTLMNTDPYDSGWLLEVHPEKAEEELSKLLDAGAYKELIKTKNA